MIGQSADRPDTLSFLTVASGETKQVSPFLLDNICHRIAPLFWISYEKVLFPLKLSWSVILAL
jgi:hypothetical protein